MGPVETCPGLPPHGLGIKGILPPSPWAGATARFPGMGACLRVRCQDSALWMPANAPVACSDPVPTFLGSRGGTGPALGKGGEAGGTAGAAAEKGLQSWS